MPAFLQSFIEAEQERSRRIEQLRKEIREFAKEEAGLQNRFCCFWQMRW
jgi:signal transduction histidine kinase